MAWFNRLIVWVMPVFPKPFVWIFARRYVAGRTLQDAVRQTRKLNAAGCTATIDVLGEDNRSLQEAETAKAEALTVLETIRKEGLRANLSVKLSQLGLRLDPGACRRNVGELVTRANALGNFVRIDMEDSTVTDATLDLYRSVRRERANAGAVIQACLRRSEADVRALIADGIAHVRLCKGIYDESPEIAFKGKEEVREQYRKLAGILFDAGAFVGLATHDRALVDWCVATVRERNIPNDRFEFQMLYGVAEKMRARLVSQGFALRVYVPFGELWYAYSMRRMRENPAVAGHIVKSLFIRT
jgi:proline dehydrogenase